MPVNFDGHVRAPLGIFATLRTNGTRGTSGTTNRAAALALGTVAGLLSHRNPSLGCRLSRSPRRGDAELPLFEGGHQSPVSLNRLEMLASLFLCDAGHRRIAHQAHKQTDCYVYVGTLGDAQNACGVIRLNLALVDRHAQPSAAIYTQGGIAGHPPRASGGHE